MATGKHDEIPLASFVLRIRGRPATLSFELLDVRTGERRRFTRADALTAYLREKGLETDLHETGPPNEDPA